MTRYSEHTGYRWTSGLLLAFAVFMMVGVSLVGYYVHYQRQLGPSQPIPFSHRFHNTEKKISCVICHRNVFTSANAGIPPLETCMLCHRRIIIHYPYIETLRNAYFSGEPVRWVRVAWLPDFVYFDHMIHTRQGFDCGKCHGDVAQMDRIKPAHALKMGFCIQCHRDENATHDCLACHR